MTSDRIVNEFMQMKALMSYVGDLVAPMQRMPGFAGPSTGSYDHYGAMAPHVIRIRIISNKEKSSLHILSLVQEWT